MGAIGIRDILDATGGRLIFGEPNGITGISIDSRTIGEGELFVAIKGMRFDGHDFVEEAMRRGAGAIVSIPPVEPQRGKVVVYVGNTLRALQDIARHIRRKRAVPVVGITGTNGKTTTKEMIASLLGAKYRVLKNSGNLNNQIGLPLSLSRLGESDDVAVLEMGASAPGDIRELCAIAEPDYGVLTNIGHAHLEGMGGIETVRRTKLEMLEAVGTVFANGDDSFLMDGLKKYKGRIVTYGIKRPSDFKASDVELWERGSRFTLVSSEGDSLPVELSVPGRFNIYNALAALAVSKFFSIGPEDMSRRIREFVGVPMRYEIKELGGSTVISDAYNANPASMEEALRELARNKREGRTIAVLGDMLELGSYGEEAHRKLGAWMAKMPIDVFIAVGPLMGIAADEFSSLGGRALKAADALGARALLVELCGGGKETVLVKGSRGMKMEEVLKENAV